MTHYKLALWGLGATWAILGLAAVTAFQAGFHTTAGLSSVTLAFLTALAVLTLSEVLRITRLMRAEKVKNHSRRKT
ncbi:MAG: hypothetical protein AAF641_11110 [Pseudomonadota bacterium]